MREIIEIAEKRRRGCEQNYIGSRNASTDVQYTVITMTIIIVRQAVKLKSQRRSRRDKSWYRLPLLGRHEQWARIGGRSMRESEKEICARKKKACDKKGRRGEEGGAGDRSATKGKFDVKNEWYGFLCANSDRLVWLANQIYIHVRQNILLPTNISFQVKSYFQIIFMFGSYVFISTHFQSFNISKFGLHCVHSKHFFLFVATCRQTELLKHEFFLNFITSRSCIVEKIWGPYLQYAPCEWHSGYTFAQRH